MELFLYRVVKGIHWPRVCRFAVAGTTVLTMIDGVAGGFFASINALVFRE